MNTNTSGLNPNSANELGPTFLGLQAHQLLSIIDQQGTALLTARGIDLPSRTVSTLMCLKKNKQLAVTGLASYLGLSHQLVRHRLKDLKARNLITEKSDPADLRRTVIFLTRRGKSVADEVDRLNKEVEEVYLDMFKEIGVDLYAALIKAKEALMERSLSSRIMDRQRKST